MAVVKRANDKCCHGGGKIATLVRYWWEYKMVQQLWKQYWYSSKIVNRTTIWANNPLPGYLPKIIEIRSSKRYMHAHVYCSTIYYKQDIEKKQLTVHWLMNEKRNVISLCIFFLCVYEYYSATKKFCLQKQGEHRGHCVKWTKYVFTTKALHN